MDSKPTPASAHPHSLARKAARLASSTAALAVLALFAPAQTLFFEGFDDPGATTAAGPANLVAAGWQFRTQGGTASAHWRGGDFLSDYWPSYAGSKHLTIDDLPISGQPAAAWAILPPISGVETADQLFFAQHTYSSFNLDYWELRWSPAGATGTGSAWDDVGDFTVSVPLHVQSPPGANLWKTSVGSAPGNGGRYALRYVYDTWNGGSTPMASVETVKFVSNPVPPLPGPGETVHWTPSMSPISVLDWRIVPQGGTLVIDAGVEVLFDLPDGMLWSEGDLRVEGTAGAKVLFRSDVNANPSERRLFVGYTEAFGPVMLAPATADLRHLDSEVLIDTNFGAGLGAVDSVFSQPAGATRYAGIQARRSTVVLRRTDFHQGKLELEDSYLLVEDVELDNAFFLSERYMVGSTMHLDTLDVHDYVPGPAFYGEGALALRGWDYWLGPNNTIHDNPLPVSLLGGGLATGSTVPSSGNAQDLVEFRDNEAYGAITFADVGVPYLWRFDPGFNFLSGSLTIEPDVTVMLEPDARVYAGLGSRLETRGRPGAPVRFTALDPQQPWKGLDYYVNRTRPKLEHTIVEGAQIGVEADSTVVRIESCLIRDNLIGANSNTFGQLLARKTRFFDNGEGIQTSSGSGHANLDGFTNPNWIEGNDIGYNNLDAASPESASSNYWGAPSGPSASSNPSGAGDTVLGPVTVAPFLQAPPDFGDDPPLVRIEDLGIYLTPGDKVILNWTVEDDGQIVAQRLEYSPHSENPPLSVLIPEIPPHARSIELIVPDFVQSSNIQPAVWRIVAVDDAGQEGFSDVMFDQDGPGALAFQPDTDLSGGVTVGQQFPYVFTSVTGNTFISIDDQRAFVPLGAQGYGTGVEVLFNDIPAVSTDLARYSVQTSGGWYHGPYFAIRPHPLASDTPPSVTMTSPVAGQSYAGGEMVPILWTASDDEGLRSFEIQASYDGGETWHVVVEDLPGQRRTYFWQLPESTGIDAVSVRVIGRDERFQASSDGTDTVFSIVPGPWSKSHRPAYPVQVKK